MNNVEKIIKDSGEKVTEQRRRILQVLFDVRRPMTADEVYDYLLDLTKVGRTTIYRTLELFEKKKLIRKVIFNDGVIRYESNLLTHHHHLICIGCGKIIPLDGCFVKPIEGAILRDSGFLITDHYLELYGYCAECQKRKEFESKCQKQKK
jgi:Fur family ferric uptake transcriptional regulator